MSAQTPKPRSAIHSFDIDNYLNHIVPRPRLYLLPQPIAHWFGYRKPNKDSSSKPVPVQSSNLVVWAFAFIGAFIGIAIIENVFLALPLLDGHQAPIVIASFGAAAILEYNAIESPLSQPRNLIFGHFLSATIGVAVTKLFRLLPPARFEELRWLAGAMSVGAASSVMGITKTVHPPAGATALLAATTPQITELGWWLLVLVLLAGGLMLASAMLVNNLYKRFPLYWWTPADLTALRKKPEDDIVQFKDVEKEISKPSTKHVEDNTRHSSSVDEESRSESDMTNVGSHRTDSSTQVMKVAEDSQRPDPEFVITIGKDHIVVPDWMSLSEWEKEVLDDFKLKLQNRLGDAR